MKLNSNLEKNCKTTISVFASTIPKLPLGFPLLSQAGKNPDEFLTVSVNCKITHLLWLLPIILINKKLGHSLGKFSVSCKELEIIDQTRSRYTLDGEMFSAEERSLGITTGPIVEFLKF